MHNENISIDKKIEHAKIKDYLDELKSDYFLQKIIDNIPKKKYLEIMKYNKKLQKRTKLTFNDYKEFSQLYSSIEIELKISDNKYGKFINIKDKEKEYYKIYFNNSNEDMKRNYLNQNEKVKIIKIIISHQVKSFKELFRECKYIYSIKFKKYIRTILQI